MIHEADYQITGGNRTVNALLETEELVQLGWGLVKISWILSV